MNPQDCDYLRLSLCAIRRNRSIYQPRCLTNASHSDMQTWGGDADYDAET
jgi:hypothetical protein